MRRTVLAVDDHEPMRRLIVWYLREQCLMCNVLEAGTGEAAIDLSYSARPEVVIMDIAMPGMGGIEATRRIKEGLPDTKVIILTEHDHDLYRQEATRVGADAYVLKREMHAALLSELQAMLVGLNDEGMY